MIKKVLIDIASDAIKSTLKSVSLLFHAENCFSTFTTDTNYQDIAVCAYCAHLMKGIYPNGYSALPLKEDDEDYGVIGKYRIILYDGKYPFFLDPSNILIITVTSEVKFTTSEFNYDFFTSISFDFYGTKAAEYERKTTDAIMKLKKIYYARNKKKYNQMKYVALAKGETTHRMASVSWDQVIFKEKEYLINMIDCFMRSKDMYNKAGIQYRLGILLYGKPGTGKSTIARAIAEYTEKQLVILKEGGIDNIHCFRNCVMLIEEIDRDLVSYVRGEDGEIKQVMDTRKLKQYLTQIDLVGRGCIIVATTNHIENLDEALIRDGRFDIRICMDDFDKEQAKEMCDIFEVDPNIVLSDNSDTDTYNPAELQNYLKELKMLDIYIKHLRETGLSNGELRKKEEEMNKIRKEGRDRAIRARRAVEDEDDYDD